MTPSAVRVIPFAMVAGGISSLFVLMLGTDNLGALILGAMASLPAFVAGLALGISGLGVCLATGLAVATAAGGAEAALTFIEQVAIPTGIVVSAALSGHAVSIRRLMLALCCTGVAMLALILAIPLLQSEVLGQPPVDLESLIRNAAVQYLNRTTAETGVDFGMPAETLADRFAFLAVGAGIVFWLLNVAGNALLAQGALERFGQNLRGAPHLSDLALPPLVSVAFGAALLASIVGPGSIAFVGANLAEVMALPLTFCGLAVIHMAVRRAPARLLMLIGVYVMTLLIWPMMVLLGLGVMDQWWNLRGRLAAYQEKKNG